MSVQECSKQTAHCVTFSCPLHNMSTQAEIKVRSRVWNGTLLEVCTVAVPQVLFVMVLTKWLLVFSQDYANALRVEVKGRATLRLQTDKPAIKMDNQTRGVRAVRIKVHPIIIFLLTLMMFHSSYLHRLSSSKTRTIKALLK